MDKLLQQLFGDETQTQPTAQAATAPAASTVSAYDDDSTREARRQARQQRKADHEARHRRKEFVDRYTTGDPSEGFTMDEAVDHLREMRAEMTPAEFRQAMKQTLEHLPPEQRDEVIAMMQRYKQTAPAAASSSATTSPTPQPSAIAGAAASNDAAFGNMLDSLMGSGAGGADFAAIIDDLRKGGLNAPSNKAGAQPTEADFEALLNSPLARAVLGGVAAYGMQNMQADDDDYDTPSVARSTRA